MKENVGHEYAELKCFEVHAWLSPEGASFATFIYEKAAERLLRHFTGADENKVIRQARVWCDENSRSLVPAESDAPGWLRIAFDEGARYIMTLGFFGQGPMIAAHSFLTR
jgi:hypothetical protein